MHSCDIINIMRRKLFCVMGGGGGAKLNINLLSPAQPRKADKNGGLKFFQRCKKYNNIMSHNPASMLQRVNRQRSNHRKNSNYNHFI